MITRRTILKGLLGALAAPFVKPKLTEVIEHTCVGVPVELAQHPIVFNMETLPLPIVHRDFYFPVKKLAVYRDSYKHIIDEMYSRRYAQKVEEEILSS